MSIARDELLIHRVLNGEAGRADWVELELIAQSDPEVWARLAQSLRAESLLRAALERELAVADAVEIPREVAVADFAEMPTARRARAWLGWAAAALVLVVWGMVSWTDERRERAPGAGDLVGGVAESTPGAEALPIENLLERYVESGRESGRVLGELPRMVMETRNVPGQDALEVYYVRPLVERMTVDEFYRTVSDEHGNPSRVRIPYRQVLGGGSL